MKRDNESAIIVQRGQTMVSYHVLCTVLYCRLYSLFPITPGSHLKGSRKVYYYYYCTKKQTALHTKYLTTRRQSKMKTAI